MSVITVIKNIKQIHKEDIVFVKLGKFYYCYGKDAYIISYLFKYKLSLVENRVYSCGFPSQSLNKVLAMLENRKINYVIVLLILTGVSIAMLTGNNGILTQAKLAKENTALAKEDEENKLAKNNEYINEQTGKIIPGEMATSTEKDNYSDGTDTATVPQGFTVSGKEDEQKIANGLVIYDIPESEISNVDWNTASTRYNQFVWIPVASEETYQRDFSYQCYYYINDTWTFLETTPKGSTTTDIAYLPTDIQPTTDNATNNETAEGTAVLKYNGFYIARYETGNEKPKPVSKQNATVYTDKTQTEFKTIGKDMYGDSSNYVKSAMCSGIQWDMVMKFVDGKKDDNGNTYDVRKVDPTRHTGSKTEAGKNVADKVQNIYDLEGNCGECVAEKNNTGAPFVGRSGYYNSGDGFDRASLRAIDMGDANSDRTFRSALYIK